MRQRTGVEVRLLVVVTIIVAAAVHAPGQGPSSRTAGETRPAEGIVWLDDVKKAAAQATKTKRPLLVVMPPRQSSADDVVGPMQLSRPGIIWESRHFVCLIGCDGSHASAALETIIGPEPACAQFDGIRCAGHRRVAAHVRGLALPAVPDDVPQYVFLEPDGKKLLSRHVGFVSEEALHEHMRAALRRLHGMEAAPTREAVVKELLAGTEDRNPDRRQQALFELMSLDHERVTKGLRRLLGSTKKQSVLLEVAMAMGESRQLRFTPSLHKLLTARSVSTRVHAAVALEKIRSPHSVPHLAKALARARRGQVRANLLRALAECAVHPASVRTQMRKLMRSSDFHDRVAALYVAGRFPLSRKLVDAVRACARASDRRVRAAAYVVVGVQRLHGLTRIVERRAPSERSLARTCASWAIDRLTVHDQAGENDMMRRVRDLLPDNHLREGKLTPDRPSRWDFRRR